MVATVRQICKVYAPYGSELYPLYGSWWRHTVAIWKPCGPYRRWMAPYGSQLRRMWGAYGGHMGAICTAQEVDGLWEPCGAIRETDGIIWVADGAIWEQRAQYGAHMVVVSLCGSRMHHMGAVCPVWAPCMPCGSHKAPKGRRMGGSHVPYGSHWCHMGAIWKRPISEMDGTIWDLLELYGGHMGAVCTMQ
jgi:hypothetical protein